MTSWLSLRCRTWCTIWCSKCKGSTQFTNPTKVKHLLYMSHNKKSIRSFSEQAGALEIISTDHLLWFLTVDSALWNLFIHTRTRLVLSRYLSLILCFWQCYQRYNSKQKYTCSLRKSSTAASSESCSATEKAPERANTDKSHTFPLWCERDLKRKALHHRERLCPICLQHFSP